MAQLVQLGAETAEYIPPMQLTHAVAAVEGWYIPAVQVTHMVAAAVEYLPVVQFKQSVEVEEPLAVSYFPATQLVQLEEPVFIWYVPAAH